MLFYNNNNIIQHFYSAYRVQGYKDIVVTAHGANRVSLC